MMKLSQKLLAIVSSFVLFIGAVTPAHAQSTEWGANLAPNPGFESTNGGWIDFKGNPVTVSQATFHGGACALQVTGDQVKSSASIPLTAGKQYKFSAWVHGQVMMALALSNSAFDYYYDNLGEVGKWTKLEWVYTVPIDVTAASLLFLHQGQDAFVDDVSFQMAGGESGGGEEEPTSPPAVDPKNLLPDSNFEAATNHWIDLINGQPIEISTAQKHTGTSSMKITKANKGVKLVSLIDVTPGDTYKVSAWVYGGAYMTSALFNAAGEFSGSYAEYAGAGEDGKWTKLEATYTVPDGVAKMDFEIIAVSDSAWVDEVSFTEVGGEEEPIDPPAVDPKNLLPDSNFEAATNHWVDLINGQPIEISSAQKHTGTSSMKITKANKGVKLVSLIDVTPGDTYKVSAWIYGGAYMTSALFSAAGEFSGSYAEYAGAGEDGKWTKLEATYTVPDGVAKMDFEIIAISDSAWVDEVSFTEAGGEEEPIDPPENDPNNLVQNSTFESSSDGWVRFDDNPIEIAVDQKHSGTSSMAISNSSGVKMFPAINVAAGKTYQIGAWVYGPVTMTSATYTAEGAHTGYADYSVVGEGGKWSHLTVDYTVPAGVGQMDVSFTTTAGRAWVDDVLFKPEGGQPSVDEANNLVPNAGFESDTQDWIYIMDGLPAELTNQKQHNGSRSLAFGKTKKGVKPAALISVSEGKSYKIGVWVNGPVTMTSALFKPDGALIGYADYDVSGGVDGEWTYLETFFTVPQGSDIGKMDVEFTTEAERVWLDDVRFIEVGENMFLNPGFEENTGDWATMNDIPLEYSTTVFHEGERSLSIPAENGVKQTERMEILFGVTYDVSAWVYGKVDVYGMVYDTNGDAQGYYNSGSPFISGGKEGTWSKIEGTFKAKDESIAFLHVEFRSRSDENYIDDVSFRSRGSDNPDKPNPSYPNETLPSETTYDLSGMAGEDSEITKLEFTRTEVSILNGETLDLAPLLLAYAGNDKIVQLPSLEWDITDSLGLGLSGSTITAYEDSGSCVITVQSAFKPGVLHATIRVKALAPAYATGFRFYASEYTAAGSDVELKIVPSPAGTKFSPKQVEALNGEQQPVITVKRGEEEFTLTPGPFSAAGALVNVTGLTTADKKPFDYVVTTSRVKLPRANSSDSFTAPTRTTRISVVKAIPPEKMIRTGEIELMVGEIRNIDDYVRVSTSANCSLEKSYEMTFFDDDSHATDYAVQDGEHRNLIQGIAVGRQKVIVTLLHNAVSVEVPINVVPNSGKGIESNYSVSNSNVSIKKDGAIYLRAVGVPFNAEIAWASDNDNVTVTAKTTGEGEAEIVAAKAGTSTITVKLGDIVIGTITVNVADEKA